MSIAEPLPDNIRRIAVLVSSVDSATSRQLLLHLPTHVAKQVRRALQNLGPVSATERQRILAEFQSTAARQTAPAAVKTSAPAGAVRSSYDAQSSENDPFNQANSFQSSNHDRFDAHLSGTNNPAFNQPLGQLPAEQLAAPEQPQSSWARMDIRALSHFLRSERPTVIAVVINQLPPNTGVALLQQLPIEIHRDILQAIAGLQEIDSEAMQAIEEHLGERLRDYETKIDSVAKGTRRVAALLAAAPPELQETWSRFVHIAVDGATDAPPEVRAASPVQVNHRAANVAQPLQVAAPKSVERVAEQSTSQQLPPTFEPQVITTADQQLNASYAPNTSHAAQNEMSDDDESAYILPFPGAESAKPFSAVDRSLIQLEFEQILSLSTHQLAQILTAADSQTVLLALAGASPTFMKRFYAMLNKPDAKALASRLSQIGPLKLRDIDEAQRSISELAAKLNAPRANTQSTSRSPRLRVAA